MASDTVLEGQRVRLRPLSEHDLPLLREWDQDQAIIQFVGKKFGGQRTPRAWLLDLSRNRHRLGMAIETEAEGLIGDVELEDINWHQRTAELRICIGRKSCWGRGYGTEAVRLVSRYAFGVLGLRSVYLRVGLTNWRAIRCYQKCGFVPEGVLRAGRRRGDQPDLALMVLNRYNKKNQAYMQSAMKGEEYGAPGPEGRHPASPREGNPPAARFPGR